MLVWMALVMRLERALVQDDARSAGLWLAGRRWTVLVEWSMRKSDVHGMD